MDTQQNGQAAAPMTDDQELANVLAGMNQQAGANDQVPAGLQFEETPMNSDAPAQDQTPAQDSQAPLPPADPVPDPSVALPPLPPVDLGNDHSQTTPAASPELESIKKNALEELRPLVDRLNVPADEKFDTLLLIIRSTDDQSLVTAAYEAAKTIEDDGRRAQALLDVIKEIDYFANQSK